MSRQEEFDRANALRQEAEDANTRFVLSTPAGRAFVWNLLDQCNVYGASFTGDPLRTAFNEGRRDIGIRLLRNVLGVEPNVFNTMRAEAEETAKSYHMKHQNDDERDDL